MQSSASLSASVRPSSAVMTCYAASWGMARSTDRKNRVLRVRASSLVAAHESVGALLRLHQCRERGPDSAHAAFRGRGEGQVAVWFLPAGHVVHWLPALDCDPKANQGACFQRLLRRLCGVRSVRPPSPRSWPRAPWRAPDRGRRV
jgi:hypothetical protein